MPRVNDSPLTAVAAAARLGALSHILYHVRRQSEENAAVRRGWSADSLRDVSSVGGTRLGRKSALTRTLALRLLHSQTVQTAPVRLQTRPANCRTQCLSGGDNSIQEISTYDAARTEGSHLHLTRTVLHNYECIGSRYESQLIAVTLLTRL